VIARRPAILVVLARRSLVNEAGHAGRLLSCGWSLRMPTRPIPWCGSLPHHRRACRRSPCRGRIDGLSFAPRGYAIPCAAGVAGKAFQARSRLRRVRRARDVRHRAPRDAHPRRDRGQPANERLRAPHSLPQRARWRDRLRRRASVPRSLVVDDRRCSVRRCCPPAHCSSSQIALELCAPRAEVAPVGGRPGKGHRTPDRGRKRRLGTVVL
jgi:hypothetical protein